MTLTLGKLLCTLLQLTAASQAPSEQSIRPSETQTPAAGQFPLPMMVDGETSPTAAVQTFMEAARSGDHQAALAMFDPQTRPIFSSQIMAEQVVHRIQMLDQNYYEQPSFQPRGFSLLYAQRDLVRVSAYQILNRREIDSERVEFSIQTTQMSFNGPKTQTLIYPLLAVQRNGRWYVFRLLGLANAIICLPLEGGPLKTTIRPFHKSAREGIDFEDRYNVPFATIHLKFVEMHRQPKMRQHQQQAELAIRQLRVLENRLQRNDFPTRSGFRKFAKRIQEPLESMIDQHENFMFDAFQKISLTQFHSVNPPQIIWSRLLGPEKD